MPRPYEGQAAALATIHGKARAIGPAFRRRLGLALVVPEGIDTDRLGTFTGEVPRPAGLKETAVLKARVGLAATGLPLSVASEGSFGPHPVIPFLAAAREALAFVDIARGLTLVEERVSERTNFAALDLTPGADIPGFLARARFPSHGLILRSGGQIIKGITDPAHLARLLEAAEAPSRLETDMRAHMNPTRMVQIARLAHALARRLATPCPACSAPGFGLVRTETGLPCADCGAPTGLVKAELHGCARCGHEQRLPRKDGLGAAPPAACPLCNP